MPDQAPTPEATPAPVEKSVDAPIAPVSPTPQPALVAYTPQDVHTAREWLIAANPGVIPELVTGSTITELQASLPAAKAAYDRALATVGAAPQATQLPVVQAGGAGSPSQEAAPATTDASAVAPGATAAPVVPNGAPPAVPVDYSKLPPEEKLAVGIAQRQHTS